ARLQTRKSDRLTCLFTIAVGALFDPAQSRVDLGDQLALAITGAEFEAAVGFGSGAVGEVGERNRVLLQAFDGGAALFEYLVLPDDELAAEIFALALAHERLGVGRPVRPVLRRHYEHSRRSPSLPAGAVRRLIAAWDSGVH